MSSVQIADNYGLLPLASVTLPEQIADRIVDAICIGQISSGQRVIESEMAGALHVSRGPIREAIRILGSQGILVPGEKRGMQVADFNKTWSAQLIDARIAIERQAAQLASLHLIEFPGQLKSLVGRIDDFELAQGDWFAVSKADIAFHTRVFELAQSPLLLTLWGAISRHVQIRFSIETNRDPDFGVVLKEHRAYLEALMQGNERSLSEEVSTHIDKRELESRRRSKY